MLKYTLALFLSLSALGCAVSKPSVTVPEYGKPGLDQLPSIISWNADLDGEAQMMWLTEAKKRFANPVVFSCHGDYEIIEKQEDGKTITEWVWYVYPDSPRKAMPAEDAAATLANLYPDRDIVFSVCNSRGHALRVERVFYARQSVWIIPDSMQPKFKFLKHEEDRNRGNVGSIWEFVAYPGDGKKRDVIQPEPSTQPTTRPTSQPATQPVAPASRPAARR